MAANGKRDRKRRKKKNREGEKKLKISAIKNFRNTGSPTCSSHEGSYLHIFFEDIDCIRRTTTSASTRARKLYGRTLIGPNHSTYALDVNYAVSPSFRTAVFQLKKNKKKKKDSVVHPRETSCVVRARRGRGAEGTERRIF